MVVSSHRGSFWAVQSLCLLPQTPVNQPQRVRALSPPIELFVPNLVVYTVQRCYVPICACKGPEEGGGCRDA